MIQNDGSQVKRKKPKKESSEETKDEDESPVILGNQKKGNKRL